MPAQAGILRQLESACYKTPLRRTAAYAGMTLFSLSKCHSGYITDLILSGGLSVGITEKIRLLTSANIEAWEEAAPIHRTLNQQQLIESFRKKETSRNEWIT